MDQVLVVYNCSKKDSLVLDRTVVIVFDKFDVNIVRCLLWSPYGMGQTILFSSCVFFFLLLFFLA